MKHRLIITCVLVFPWAMVGCTTVRQVPIESVIHPDLAPTDRLSITTLDGRKHRLGRWETTDSSVVVISVNKVDSDVRTEIPATPYEILFSSIDHVTKREVARGRSFLLLFGPMLLIPVIIYFAGSAAGRV